MLGAAMQGNDDIRGNVVQIRQRLMEIRDSYELQTLSPQALRTLTSNLCEMQDELLHLQMSLNLKSQNALTAS